MTGERKDAGSDGQNVPKGEPRFIRLDRGRLREQQDISGGIDRMETDVVPIFNPDPR